MLSIFNGRRRELSEGGSAVFMQLDTQFGAVIKNFKNGRNLNSLAVFLVIALRGNEHGWSKISCEEIQEATGLATPESVTSALAHLRKLKIKRKPVLAHFREQRADKQHGSSYFHVFPAAGGAPPVDNLVLFDPAEKGEPSPDNLVAGPSPDNPLPENPVLSYIDSKESLDSHDSSLVLGSIQDNSPKSIESNPKEPDSVPAKRARPPAIPKYDFVPEHYYPVDHEAKTIYPKGYAVLQELELAIPKSSCPHALPVLGQEIIEGRAASGYKMIGERHLVFDAFAECGWGMKPGFNEKALNGDKKQGGAVGAMVRAYAALFNLEPHHLKRDKERAQAVRDAYRDYKLSNPGGPLLRRPESFVAWYNEWDTAGRKPIKRDGEKKKQPERLDLD